MEEVFKAGDFIGYSDVDKGVILNKLGEYVGTFNLYGSDGQNYQSFLNVIFEYLKNTSRTEDEIVVYNYLDFVIVTGRDFSKNTYSIVVQNSDVIIFCKEFELQQEFSSLCDIRELIDSKFEVEHNYEGLVIRTFFYDGIFSADILDKNGKLINYFSADSFGRLLDDCKKYIDKYLHLKKNKKDIPRNFYWTGSFGSGCSR